MLLYGGLTGSPLAACLFVFVVVVAVGRLALGLAALVDGRLEAALGVGDVRLAAPGVLGLPAPEVSLFA